jgi:hypothetical protein
MTQIIDIMDTDISTTPPMQPTALVGGLSRLLGEVGLPGELSSSKRLLDRAEQLAEKARTAKMAAQQRWEHEREQLFTGEVDTDQLARTVVELGPWLDENSAAMMALMAAAQHAQGRAAQMVNAEASGLYAKLQKVAATTVEETAALPPIPQQMWSAPNAATVAIQAGHGRTWEQLVLLATRFAKVHEAANLLVSTGGVQHATMFPGIPDKLGRTYRTPMAAVDRGPGAAPAAVRPQAPCCHRPGVRARTVDGRRPPEATQAPFPCGCRPWPGPTGLMTWG